MGEKTVTITFCDRCGREGEIKPALVKFSYAVGDDDVSINFGETCRRCSKVVARAIADLLLTSGPHEHVLPYVGPWVETEQEEVPNEAF